MKRLFFTLISVLTLGLISCGSTTVQQPAAAKETVQTPVENKVDDDEYKRSITALGTTETVSKEEFFEDKTEIIRIISELSKIMEKEDYEAWLNYISPASKKYYSQPAIIQKVQKKIPDKTITLHGLKDYFLYVFIPSRKRSQVDEIRYINKYEVKAVNVLKDNSTIVYYNFVKENNKWLVKIPTL